MAAVDSRIADFRSEIEAARGELLSQFHEKAAKRIDQLRKQAAQLERSSGTLNKYAAIATHVLRATPSERPIAELVLAANLDRHGGQLKPTAMKIDSKPRLVVKDGFFDEDAISVKHPLLPSSEDSGLSL